MPSRIVAVKHDFVAGESPCAKVSDKLASLRLAERAEDGRAGDDAGDRLGVHGADNTLGRAPGTNVLIADWYEFP